MTTRIETTMCQDCGRRYAAACRKCPHCSSERALVRREPFAITVAADGSVELRPRKSGIDVLAWIFLAGAIVIGGMRAQDLIDPWTAIILAVTVALVAVGFYRRHRSQDKWVFDAQRRAVFYGDEELWAFDEIDGVYWYHNRYVPVPGEEERLEDRFELYVKVQDERFLIAWFLNRLAADRVCERIRAVVGTTSSPEAGVEGRGEG